LVANVHNNITYNNSKVETTQMSITDEWIFKMWYIYTIEYYLMIKGNEVLTYITSYMNSEYMLIETSHAKKIPNYRNPFI
jgi:predicted phage-related endonuclease